MGAKRKAGDHTGAFAPVEKKVRQAGIRSDSSKLTFNPQPDWHAVEIPPLDQNKATAVPPQRTIDELHKYAHSLLEAENAAYNASHLSGSSSHKFLSTIMSSGTLEDKVSALTLLVQESPMHTMKAFDSLLGLAKKKSRNQALMALAALKDLLGQGVVLPARKLRAFGKQAGLLSSLQGKGVTWKPGDALPEGLEKKHLMLWAYEDWLKKKYFEMLQILEGWCNDEVEYSRSRAITYVWELLKDKPEQEENLLRMLVNKLGDTNRKIASRASYLLLQLEITHPAMKLVVTNNIESDCLFRPGQSLHAKYYAIITLNQTILSQKEEELANRLLDIYFSLFVNLLKPLSHEQGAQKSQTQVRLQRGGGKAGKLAAQKRKIEERSDEAEIQLRDKMIAQVLTGVNRAFPFADAVDPKFEKQMDTIFRIAHSSNFNTSLQALVLIQQISSTKHYGADRFYRTLYEILLDSRLATSSKQVIFLNLLYKSLKNDLNAKRVQAFVKRLLQILTLHDSPFACGVLYLIRELESTFPIIRTMMTEPEENGDEEEHFEDANDDGHAGNPPVIFQPSTSEQKAYDPRKRDPEHCHAESTCLWEIIPFLQHFHPSVSIFAESILLNKAMPPKPDPTQQTLMHFLDRFVYRNPKAKPAAFHGASIMQPLAGATGRADMLVRPGVEGFGNSVPVNTEAFWRKKAEDVAADEVFFHSYFNQPGSKMRKIAQKTQKTKAEIDEIGSEEESAEEEIWQALAQSRPDIEGNDDDDDLSMGDLESTYSDSSENSEPGIDLGGEDEDDGDDGADLEDAFAHMDGLSAHESENKELLGSYEEAIAETEKPCEKEERAKLLKSRITRKDRKKFTSLPMFASAEDYAKLLADEPDGM